jgi:hypothetical protein
MLVSSASLALAAPASATIFWYEASDKNCFDFKHTNRLQGTQNLASSIGDWEATSWSTSTTVRVHRFNSIQSGWKVTKRGINEVGVFDEQNSYNYCR